MRVAVLGASGFLGKAVSLALLSKGYEVVACVRSAERGRLLGSETELFIHPSGVPDPTLLEQCDAVVNLAGSPLVGRRWSKRRIREAERSRIDLTTKLVDALSSASVRPRVLVSASAIGFYEKKRLPHSPLDESSPAGTDTLSRLCARWERAALGAQPLGIRVVLPRLGVVLGRFGGVLEILEPAFRLGFGASLSSGRQPFSWVHIEDVCRAVVKFIEEENLEGPFNLVSPEPVTYKEFVDALAAQCTTQVVFSVPSFLVRVGLGEGADALLAGTSVVPAKLQSVGFEFRFTDLGDALDDLFHQAAITVAQSTTVEEAFGGFLPPSTTSAARSRALEAFLSTFSNAKGHPGVLLQSVTEVAASKGQVFEFYSVPANLHALMPPRLPFRLIQPPPKAEEGSVLTYEVGRPPFTRRYRGTIVGVRNPDGFYDMPLDHCPLVWFHSHRFEESRKVGNQDNQGTVISDDVWFWVPAAARVRPLRYASRLNIPLVRHLFEYRAQVNRWRFGAF